MNKTHSKENKAGFTTLDRVVRKVIADQGYDTLHKYLRYLGHAYDELREWRVHGSMETRSKIGQMTHNKTFAFPEDFISLIKVGILVGDRIHAFVPDNTVATKHPTSFKEKPYMEKAHADLAAADSNMFFTNVYYGNGRIGQLRGWGQGHNGAGYFKPDWECRHLVFTEEVNRNAVIVMEYVSDGVNLTCGSVVETFAVDMMKYGILKRDIGFRFGFNSREFLGAEAQWEKAWLKAQAALSDLTYEGMINALGRFYSLNIA